MYAATIFLASVVDHLTDNAVMIWAYFNMYNWAYIPYTIILDVYGLLGFRQIQKSLINKTLIES